MNIFRKKSIESILAESRNKTLTPTMKTMDLVLFGIGAIIGSGINSWSIRGVPLNTHVYTERILLTILFFPVYANAPSIPNGTENTTVQTYSENTTGKVSSSSMNIFNGDISNP